MLELPVYAYSLARHLHFGWQFFAFDSLFRMMPGLKGPIRVQDPKVIKETHRAFLNLLRQDAKNISEGVYPIQVLKPESPFKHFKRFPLMLLDSFEVYRRRAQGESSQFNSVAQGMLDEVPKYYRRNFHFQTSGYLSKRSAELYEHQVETLFAGSADAVRRQVLKPMKEHFRTPTGKGLKILEIAAGTGRATRFTSLTFPQAQITAIDISDPYLQVARKNLANLSRIDFLRTNAEELPFQDETFDAVYSVFLFHELPYEARKKVVKEARRVLKPGGFFGLVDSVQKGDSITFESLLPSFPQSYHEPFFMDYVSKPMDELLEKEKISNVKTGIGAFSKVMWGTKPGVTRLKNSN
ncbi:MAG: class I SAM-dependent methyltransferase [Bdellovibrionota bacterium]